MGWQKSSTKLRPPRLPKPIVARSSLRLITERWALVGVTSIAVLGITLCLAWWLHTPLLSFIHHTPAPVLASFAAVVVLFWFVTSRHHAAAVGIFHALVYPPYWFGMALGFGIGLYVC